LAAIEERGGEVTTEEFYRLGKECGYGDPGRVALSVPYR